MDIDDIRPDEAVVGVPVRWKKPSAEGRISPREKRALFGPTTVRMAKAMVYVRDPKDVFQRHVAWRIRWVELADRTLVFADHQGLMRERPIEHVREFGPIERIVPVHRLPPAWQAAMAAARRRQKAEVLCWVLLMPLLVATLVAFPAYAFEHGLAGLRVSEAMFLGLGIYVLALWQAFRYANGLGRAVQRHG
jgi:hypothetical protein